MHPLLKRGIISLVTVWLIVSVAFVCIYALPGDPARMILGRQASDESIRAFREQAGLNQPMYRQYWLFLYHTARLEFGDSLLYRRPVRSLIAQRSHATLMLCGYSVLVMLLGAFVLPVCLTLVGRPFLHRLMKVLFTFAGIAPPYVLGITVLMFFAGKLGWIAVIFDGSSIRSWILPSLVLAAYPCSIVMRLFDSELASIQRSTYVLHAQALGFSPAVVLLREILPNALTAALPGFANALAVFITGAFFVEVIFTIPGLGRLSYEAISNKDIGLLAGLCVTFAVAVVAISTLMEAVRFALDPRLRGRDA